MYKVAVLISGSGSNMESLVRYSAEHPGIYKVTHVISDREAGGLKRAENLRVKNVTQLNRKDNNFNEKLLDILNSENPDAVVLAGYLSVIPPEIIKRFEGRIINIHPSLLPLYGGMGMHGLNVHRACLESGNDESGCSCHIVTEDVDKGEVLVQYRVGVEPSDTPEILRDRILPFEHRALPEGLVKLLTKKENI